MQLYKGKEYLPKKYKEKKLNFKVSTRHTLIKSITQSI